MSFRGTNHSNHSKDKVQCITGIHDHLIKSNNVIHYIDKLKEKNHMILSIDANKSFHKIKLSYTVEVEMSRKEE